MLNFKKPENYCIKTSPQEIYQTERFYQLTVRDYAGFIQNFDNILDEMFDKLAEHRLRKFIKNDDRFDRDDYHFKVVVEDCRSDSAIVNVIITRKSIVTKIKSWIALPK